MTSLKSKFFTILGSLAMCLCMATAAPASWSGPAAWDEPWPWDQDLSKPYITQPQPEPATCVTPTGDNPGIEPSNPAPTKGAADLQSVGQALCAAGLNADIDALLNLIEPNSFNMMMEMMGSFSDEEEGLNPLEAFKAEFRAEMQADPLVSCTVADAKNIECDLQGLEDLSMLAMPAPQACGMITMRSQQAGDQEPKDDEIQAVRIDGRWYIVFL